MTQQTDAKQIEDIRERWFLGLPPVARTTIDKARSDIATLLAQMDVANQTIAEKDKEIQYLEGQIENWRNLMETGLKIMQGSATISCPMGE